MKVNRLISYIFYFGLVVAVLSLTNLPIGIFHTSYINIIILVLNCLILFYLGVNNLKIKGAGFSSIALLLYIIVFFFSYKSFNIDWSALLLVTFVPLISFHDEYFIRNALYIKIGLVFFVIVLFTIGILEETTISKLNSVGHSLGFFHPNTLGGIFFSVVCDITVLFRNKRGNLHLYLAPLLLCLTYVFYKITYSRTSMIITVLLIICFAFKDILTRFIFNKQILVLTSSLVMIFGVCISIFYTPHNIFYFSLNKFLTNRLYLGSLYFHRYGFTLLPKLTPNIIPEGWWSVDAVFNDNNYLKFVLSQGLIISTVIFMYILHNIFENKYTVFTGLIILIILSYLLVEAQGFNVFLYTPLLFNYVSEVSNDKFVRKENN